MTRNEAIRYRRHITTLITDLPDAEALKVTDLFVPWAAGAEYAAGDRVQYGGHLYACVQGHTSQTGWEPDIVPALWRQVSVEEWPEWVQPTGAQDAYALGDKVSHNGSHWISTANNNVREPGVYGWEVA